MRFATAARALAVATGICLALGEVAPVAANHLDELILFDQTGADKKLDEGLVRQRLGLLDADGKPAIPLVPLVSADGKRAGYDMTGGGTNPTFDNRLIELRNDGGILTLMTHGNRGVLVMERVLVKGFGAGTGSNDGCAQAALAVTTVRTNVTVNLAVCKGDDAGGGVTSVAASLRAAIVAAGGSVRTMNATVDPVDVLVRLRVRPRDGAQFTAGEVTAIQNAHAAHVTAMQNGLAFIDQFRNFQNALDTAAPADQNGRRIFARINYYAEIGALTLEKISGEHRSAEFETLDAIIADAECADGCDPVAAIPTAWSNVKGYYR